MLLLGAWLWYPLFLTCMVFQCRFVLHSLNCWNWEQKVALPENISRLILLWYCCKKESNNCKIFLGSLSWVWFVPSLHTYCTCSFIWCESQQLWRIQTEVTGPNNTGVMVCLGEVMPYLNWMLRPEIDCKIPRKVHLWLWLITCINIYPFVYGFSHSMHLLLH